MKKRVTKKLVPVTTHNITKAIIDFLLIRGHSASRINTQGQAYEDETGRTQWRRSGSRRGFFDIAVALRLKSGRAAAFLVVEVKKGKDELGDDQIKFIEELNKCNGLHFEAKTFPDFKEYYENYLEPEIINKL